LITDAADAAHATNELNKSIAAAASLVATSAPVGGAALVSLLGILNGLRTISGIVKEVNRIR
jgi:hypothetical protein